VTPPQIAASRGRDPIVWLIICGALLVATIIVGTIIMVGEFRERALSNGERELENTVQLLTRHFDQLFDDCEIITAGLISQMRLSEISSPDTFRERVSTAQTHEVLRAVANVPAFIGSVTLFAADGQLVNSSDTFPLPAVSVFDRPFFQRFKSDPNAPAVIIEPARNLLTGTSTTIIAHRLNAPNGTFLGVMARRIDPSIFEKFLASVVLGPGAAIALFHTDGTMLARYPHIEAMNSRRLRSCSARSRRAACKRCASRARSTNWTGSAPARLWSARPSSSSQPTPSPLR
jgi:hypothetical protein